MQSDTLTFTVIVALYNCERYIAECLGSLRTQSFDDFEAIVVDDCSTDDGLRVAKAAVTDDERFRFLSTPANGGQGAARNVALEAARGRIVVLLDADDLLVPHALEHIAERFNEQQLDDLYFNAESFYEDAEAYNRVVEDFSGRDSFDGVATGMELFTFFEDRGQFFPHGALRAVSRSLIEDNAIRFPEGIIHEDLLFTLQTLVCSQRSSFLNEPLYRRRIRSGSTMASKHRTMRNIEGHLVSIRWMRSWTSTPIASTATSSARWRTASTITWMCAHGTISSTSRRAIRPRSSKSYPGVIWSRSRSTWRSEPNPFACSTTR